MKNICKIASVSLLLLLASCIKSDYDTENCPGLYTITPIVPVELQQKKNEFLPNTNTSVMYPGGEWRKTEVGPENILELTKGQYRAVSLKGESEQVGLQGGVFVSVSSADGAAGEPGDFVEAISTSSRWRAGRLGCHQLRPADLYPDTLTDPQSKR